MRLDDPITAHVPDFQPRLADGTAPVITIRHLLTHTSGIPNYTALPDFRNFARTPMTVPALVNLFKDKALDFAPGEKYSYSNSGYIVMGYVIERVSGKSYRDFLRENIFGPLRMTNSGYDGSMLLDHRAADYVELP